MKKYQVLIIVFIGCVSFESQSLAALRRTDCLHDRSDCSLCEMIYDMKESCRVMSSPVEEECFCKSDADEYIELCVQTFRITPAQVKAQINRVWPVDQHYPLNVAVQAGNIFAVRDFVASHPELDLKAFVVAYNFAMGNYHYIMCENFKPVADRGMVADFLKQHIDFYQQGTRSQKQDIVQ